MQPRYEYYIGVDEAGRGPLAGPVAVGAVLMSAGFAWALLPGVHDSKQVSPAKRLVIFHQAKKLQQQGQLDFAVVLVGAKTIDAIGIVPAIERALERAIGTLASPLLSSPNWYQRVLVQLDGGLKAPAEYVQQETIIKGDAKERTIGLASIMAKVTRDRYMEQQAKKTDLLVYNFAQHKGYGTKQHREAIAVHGLSNQHRRTFCRNINIRGNSAKVSE